MNAAFIGQHTLAVQDTAFFPPDITECWQYLEGKGGLVAAASPRICIPPAANSASMQQHGSAQQLQWERSPVPRCLFQDPKEATRERIDRLRREGAVSIEEPGHDKGSLPPALKPALKPGRAAAAEVRIRACMLLLSGIHTTVHSSCCTDAHHVCPRHSLRAVGQWMLSQCGLAGA